MDHTKAQRAQITEAFADGEDVFIHQLLYAVRPTSADDDLEKLKARWSELTGSDPGEDVYILGTGFTTDRVVLPRQTFLSIIQLLLKLRAEFPVPKIWLFRVDPYHLTPANGEEEVVRKLEERAVALKAQAQNNGFNEQQTKLLHDLKEAGLFSEVYSEEKQYWLELWGFTTLLDYHRTALTSLRQKQPTVQDYVIPSRSEQPLSEANGATPSFARVAAHQHAHLGLSS